ncbi:phosphate ABC transporter permease subunit PstC [Halomarina salina]|uniref:Phosphate transport system permease protein n=1 Tax=Halomarina salina TaxID=1872699 RepID=A0ABD5RMV8_9EURY|nr:phosphate ABC transporter permease subunit PstC [Halomarina salina]
MSEVPETNQSSGVTGVLDNATRGGVAVSAVGLVCLAGAFASFLLSMPYTFPLLFGFVVVMAYGWVTRQAETARTLTFVATVSTVGILGLITVYIVVESIPAISHMGPDILTRMQSPLWEPGAGVYSLLPLIWGTVVTTLIATAIAAPFGVAGALFIGEIAPRSVRDIIKPAVEVLAGIPSIVYGFIGFTVLNPYLTKTLRLPGQGSLFLAGVVIGFMALPTVVSVGEDAIASVPESMKSGSLALGTTDWQTMKSVTLPTALSGLSAAILLGVGRAIGETMAATVILGKIPAFPDPLYDVFGNTITLTATIASQYGSAAGRPLHESALFAAGVVLFVTVMCLSIASQYIEARMQRKLGGNE